MPQLEKGRRWTPKASYNRATGFVKSHSQRYVIGSRERKIEKAKRTYTRTHKRERIWFEPPKDYIYYDQTKNWHRFRMIEPSEFEVGSFRTIKKQNNNMHIVVGRLKGETTTTTQSIRYRKVKIKKE